MFTTRGIHDAITERSPAYAILGIDSEDRFKDYDDAAASRPAQYNGSPYNFQITKNESIMNGFFTRLAVTEVNFPWTIGNLLPNNNEITVEYSVAGVAQPAFSVVLPTGFLRPSQIAAFLQLAIRTEDPVNLGAFTMTYGVSPQPGVPAPLGPSVAAYPYFVYDTSAATVEIGFFQLPPNSAAWPYPSTVKQLFDLLGFDSQNNDLAQKGNGLSTYCQSIRYIDIICNQLTYNQALKDTMSQPIARDTLCRLYLGDGPYTGTSTMSPDDPDFCPPGCAPFTIYRQFTNPKFIRWLPNQPVQGNLQFQVFDDNGALLSNVDELEGAGTNWSMTLLVSED